MHLIQLISTFKRLVKITFILSGDFFILEPRAVLLPVSHRNILCDALFPSTVLCPLALLTVLIQE